MSGSGGEWDGKRAGVPGRVIHDLRRSAARDFRRAGVSEGEIMKLCGWETRSMFDRYDLIDEADLARAVAKRFANGAPLARLEAPAPAPAPLSSSATEPLAPRPTAGHQTLDLGMVVRIHRGQLPTSLANQQRR